MREKPQAKSRRSPRRAAAPADDFEPRLVGGEIRDLRKARRMTIQAMAAATDLSVGHLSEIERGIASPSLDALHAIAAALGVTIGWFLHNVETPDAGERPFVVRAGRRRKLRAGAGIADELLSPHLRGAFELVLSKLAPGAGVEKRAHGEEAGLVLSGTLELWIENRKFVLKEGDSFSIEGARPHRYRNPGKVQATVVWAITPPGY